MKPNYSKLIIVGIILLIIWSVFLYFLINYSNELRDHPCNICAKKMGENVVCSTFGGIQVFTPNGTIDTNYYNLTRD